MAQAVHTPRERRERRGDKDKAKRYTSMSMSSVLHQCPRLGAPGSSPALEATLERGAPRENPGELAVDVCTRHLGGCLTVDRADLKEEQCYGKEGSWEAQQDSCGRMSSG